MVIIYNIGIGKWGDKKASETIESERPRDNVCEGGRSGGMGQMGSDGEGEKSEQSD